MNTALCRTQRRYNKQIHLFSSHPAVEVRLHEPLWKVQFSPEDVAIEVVALCSQLEPLLCMKEYAVKNISIAFMNSNELFSLFRSSFVCIS